MGVPRRCFTHSPGNFLFSTLFYIYGTKSDMNTKYKKEVKPWEQHPEFWKDKKSYLNYMGNQVFRRAWNTMKIKNKFKSERCHKKIVGKFKNGRDRTLLHGRCDICKKEYPKNKLQVDHIDPVGSITYEDIGTYIRKLFFVGYDDLQLLCNGDGTNKCHDIKTHADRHGISFEQAEREKEVIAFKKLPAKKQKQTLKKLGYEEKLMGNEEKRILLFRKHYNI